MSKITPPEIIEAERELILLMGYENPVLGNLSRKFHAKPSDGSGKMKEFPQWGRDNAAAFELASEYDLSVNGNATRAVAKLSENATGDEVVTEEVALHTDKLAAMRMAVLRAAILKQKLQGAQATRH